MERTPVISKLFHFRRLCLLLLLGYIDFYHIRNYYMKTTYAGETAHLAIGFEYYSLFFTLIHMYLKYILHTIDSRRSAPWDKKNTYFMILDIIFSLLKISMYLETIYIIWKMDHFPLFMVRPLFLTMSFLKNAVKDFILSRRAIGFMNTVFKDGTREDLDGLSDPTCIICREEMTDGENPLHGVVKKLPCNHMFHRGCLTNWFQRQQTCPICRMDVISNARSRPNPHQARNNNAHNNTETPSNNNSVPNSSQNQSPGTSSSPPVGANISASTAASTASSTQRINNTNVTQDHSHFLQTSAQLPGNPWPYYPPNAYLSQNLPQPIPGTMFPIIMPTFPQLSSMPPTINQADIDSSFLDEESLKASVEARMAALRQVQILLDAAMLQMNAYVSATAAGTATKATNEESKPSKMNDGDDKSVKLESDLPNDEEKLKDEVRKRRCEKFTVPNTTTQAPSYSSSFPANAGSSSSSTESKQS